jgi:hypothetical protein
LADFPPPSMLVYLQPTATFAPSASTPLRPPRCLLGSPAPRLGCLIPRYALPPSPPHARCRRTAACDALPAASQLHPPMPHRSSHTVTFAPPSDLPAVRLDRCRRHPVRWLLRPLSLPLAGRDVEQGRPRLPHPRGAPDRHPLVLPQDGLRARRGQRHQQQSGSARRHRPLEQAGRLEAQRLQRRVRVASPLARSLAAASARPAPHCCRSIPPYIVKINKLVSGISSELNSPLHARHRQEETASFTGHMSRTPGDFSGIRDIKIKITPKQAAVEAGGPWHPTCSCSARIAGATFPSTPSCMALAIE